MIECKVFTDAEDAIGWVEEYANVFRLHGWRKQEIYGWFNPCAPARAVGLSTARTYR